MRDLIASAKIDRTALKQFIIRRVAGDLNALSEPCYFPKLKADFYELLNKCGLTEAQVKKSMNNFYKGTKFSSFLVVKRPEFHILTSLMFYFLGENDMIGFSMTMKMFCIRQYTNLMNKQFPRFCDKEAFRYTLEHIPKIHLFAREGSIANFVVFIANEEERRYIDAIRVANPEGVGAFIQEARTRIAQSVKSFAEIYYDILARGEAYKTHEEKVSDEEGEKIQTQLQQKNVQIAEEFAKKICVYKYVDYNASMEAKKLARGVNGVINIITSEITDIKYTDSIRTIILVYLKKLVEQKVHLCSDEYFDHVKALLSIKRTTEMVFFKQQVTMLLEEMLRNRGYGEMLANQQQRFLLSLFLGYYLTLILRKQLCG